MSRVGKQPVAIPQGVEVSVQGREVKVKGPRGELALDYRTDFVDVAVVAAPRW